MKTTRIADIDAALDACAAEPVHIPGSIQRHGALIAVDNETLQVTHASVNLHSITGIDHAAALGQSIHDVFPTGVRHDLVNSMLPPFLMQDTRAIEELALNGNRVAAGASAARTATIFEFEPASGLPDVSGKAVHQIAFLTSHLHGVQSRAELFDKSVKLIQVLTGYQRVMVYEFDGDGNGTIQAESLTGGLESFLGLNFPSWDIPQQAREIMARTPFRYIADIFGTPVPVMAAGADLAPLDMTYSHLRGVSPVHMQYLENMGTKATLTLNIVVSGKLWGMISLHNPTPRVPDQNVREVCRNFVRFFGLKLDAILQRERLARLHEADQLRRELMDNAGKRQEAESLFTARLLSRLCDAMRADGALLAKEGSVQVHNLVPPAGTLDPFVKFGESCADVYHSAALRADSPGLADLVGDDIAGVHITPMARDSFVAFFRRDREKITKWAGAPHKTIEGVGGNARLRPRGSFALYKETVRGSSDPWTDEEHQIASEVWSIYVNAERNALIRKTSRQQKMLIDELNHRVRNILTLIRSLSRQSRSTADTIDDFIATLEARIEAVANAHSLAVERPDAYVSIHTMLQMEAEPHNLEGKGVVINGEDAGLRPDVAPIFALVVHELMTNAAKYGALSAPEGRVTIDLSPAEAGLRLCWTETGGPAVEPPQRKGFGTSLLTNAVPNELRGTIDVAYRETGIVVELTLPQDMLSGMRFLGGEVARSKAKADENAEAMRARGQVRCLLVEDSFVISMDTMRIMNEAGLAKVQTAMTVRDAMQAIDAERPDFAALDVNLSGGETSHGVANRLKAMGVPFVFVTGYGSEGVPRDAFDGIPVLRKPLHRADLEPVLQDFGL